MGVCPQGCSDGGSHRFYRGGAVQKRNDFLVPNRKELQNRCETITHLIVDVMLAPWYQFLTLCPFEPISQLEPLVAPPSFGRRGVRR